MEENMNVETEVTFDDANFEAPIETDSSIEALSSSSSSGNGLADVAAGAIIGLATYGVYRIGKDFVVPGAKAVFNWGKNKMKAREDKKQEAEKGDKKKAKKKTEVVDVEFEEVDDSEEE